MVILINCSNLAAGGGIQVAHSFINMLKGENAHQFHIVLSKNSASQIKKEEFPENFVFHDYTLKPSIIKAITGKNSFLDKLCNKYKANVAFTIFGPSYWNPPIPHLVGFARPKYIYKESPYFKTIPKKGKFLLFFKEWLDMLNFKVFSDAIVSESPDVSERLKVIFPKKKTYTVSNSYNQVFDGPSEWDQSLKLPPFDGTTILMISSYYYHKNFEIIPRTIDYLKNNYPGFRFRFVLTMKEGEYIFYKKSHLSHIVFLGKVSIAQCPPLYQNSDIVFQPSFLECFSAAYPEAMKMEVPLLASDLGFARGICGEAAYYFDPTSAESAGKAIIELTSNMELRKKLVGHGKTRLKMFDTPESRAKKYLEIISQIHQIHKKSY